MDTNDEKQKVPASGEETALLTSNDATLEGKGDGTWECGICTLINEVSDLHCDACGTARPQPALKAGAVEESSEDEQDVSDTAAMWGAAGAGAGVGFVLGGGLLAALGAAGGAYAASTDGKVGDVARKSGRKVVKVQRKVVELNEKHKVTEKVQAAAAGAVLKSRELNEKHQITARAQTAAVGVVNGAKELNEKHQITSRAWNAIRGGLEKAKEFNERHQVTSQVAQTAGAGLTRIERALSNRAPGSSGVVETAPAAGPASGAPVMTGVPLNASAYSAPRPPEDPVKPGEESHV